MGTQRSLQVEPARESLHLQAAIFCSLQYEPITADTSTNGRTLTKNLQALIQGLTSTQQTMMAGFIQYKTHRSHLSGGFESVNVRLTTPGGAGAEPHCECDDIGSGIQKWILSLRESPTCVFVY